MPVGLLIISISLARLFSIISNCVCFAKQCHIQVVKIIFVKQTNSKFPEYGRHTTFVEQISWLLKVATDTNLKTTGDT